MHWQLPSLLSRVQHSARRKEPKYSPPVLESEPSEERLQIDRKILQDPSALLDAETLDAFPRALTPSTRLPSADGSNNTRSRYRPADVSPGAPLQRSELPTGSADLRPRPSSRFAISRMSKIAAGGEWSTFGRKREHQVTDAPGRTSPMDNPKRTSHSPSLIGDNKNPNPSTFTLSRLTDPSRLDVRTPESRSSPSINSPRRSPDAHMHFSSKSSSPTNTTSSKRDPQTPRRPSSYTAPVSAFTTCSLTSLTAPTNRELAFDSPRTFGQPTPDNSVDFSISYPLPPPPLPPLDHPELVSWRRRTMSTGEPTSSVFRNRSNTLPANRRSPRRDDLFPSLSLRLEHSIRHQSSFPQTKQAFDKATEQHETPREGSRGRRRARTVSAGARARRTSADWSSYEATVGVNSPHANQAWPAEVSREMLRLSLTGPDRVPGSLNKPRNNSSRDRNADPVHRPDTALSQSFLPFPHPSQPSSPPPFTASATLANGREATPSRPRSLLSILENRRGSQLLGRLTMAEVKRSSSAIETRKGRRNGGGTAYTSSGLGDPAPSLSKGPQAAPLPHPSSALVPSRSLPSGRVSPITMSSSVQGEPSTPTPAPRQLSDKSRGKRKAEDNLDVTPPEQKKEKEGQRATFLLPSESRGQRISSSSHAPSSYHRKRARLSSTSPFATPVQSRPASVQETPQSRTHYFSSLSSSTGGRIASRTPSRAASAHSRQHPTPSTTRKHERHQSMSQVSIPISAIVSPHAPSISRSTKFHMRDPRKPPKKPNDTPWRLEFATEEEPGSPLQAWSFFLGFLFFPVWWIAGFLLRVPKTRIAGDVDTEKGVPIDDPQIEHDARTWRLRCRVMAVVSLFTYIPFIVLVAIFAPR